MQLETSTEIRQPPERVFAYLAHHPNHVHLVEQNLSCEQVSDGPMGVGTKLKNTARMFGPLGGRIEEHFEVVAFEPGRRLSKASREGSSFETTDSFELSQTADGTAVRFVVTVTPRNVFQRALMAVMKPVVGRAMRDTLSKLKTILEAA